MKKILFWSFLGFFGLFAQHIEAANPRLTTTQGAVSKKVTTTADSFAGDLGTKVDFTIQTADNEEESRNEAARILSIIESGKDLTAGELATFSDANKELLKLFRAKTGPFDDAIATAEQEVTAADNAHKKALATNATAKAANTNPATHTAQTEQDFTNAETMVKNTEKDLTAKKAKWCAAIKLKDNALKKIKDELITALQPQNATRVAGRFERLTSYFGRPIDWVCKGFDKVFAYKKTWCALIVIALAYELGSVYNGNPYATIPWLKAVVNQLVAKELTRDSKNYVYYQQYPEADRWAMAIQTLIWDFTKNSVTTSFNYVWSIIQVVNPFSNARHASEKLADACKYIAEHKGMLGHMPAGCM